MKGLGNGSRKKAWPVVIVSLALGLAGVANAESGAGSFMVSGTLSDESPDGTEKSLGTTTRSGPVGADAPQKGSRQGRSTDEGVSNLRDDGSTTGSTNMLQGTIRSDPVPESALGGMGGDQGARTQPGGGSNSGGAR